MTTPNVSQTDINDSQITLRQERVRLLYQNSVLSVPATILSGTIFLVMLWTKVPPTELLCWYLILIGYAIFRLIKIQRVLKNKTYLTDKHQKAMTSFLIGSSLTAAVWGSSFLLFNNYVDQTYRLLMIWIISATAMGGNMSLAASKRAQYIFITLVFTPTIFTNLFSNNEFDITLGILCILFYGVLLMLGSNFSKSVNESLQLRFKNEELLSSLQQQNKHLEVANNELIKTKEILTEQTLSDPLTGIANRRNFDNTLAREWNRCQRRQYPISCILIDVDYFKAYNDIYGHQKGDELLRQLSAIFSNLATRADDLVARYGGEEFVFILSNAAHDDGVVLAERIRQEVEKAKIPHSGNKVSEVLTVSAGVATMTPNNHDDCYALVHKADEQLYLAKNGGRNQVC